MKIAIYSHSIAPSIDGVCRRFTGLLWELQRQKHEIILFTLEEEPQELPPLQECITLDHMIIPSYPKKKVARPNIATFSKIVSHLQKHKPEVIHVTADGFSNMFALAGLLLNIPVVGSFHTDLVDLLTTHHATAFQKWCVTTKELVDSVVFNSCATTSTSFQKKLAKNGIICDHVIITAVDVETFSPSKRNEVLRREMMFGEENGFLCVFVGRISKEKRLDVIVDAVKAIPGAYLAIIGDGPSAKAFAALHGAENRIYCRPRFLSHVELAEVYASSDLHVSASEFETLGNTVLEAYACKLPVVVARTQGFCDTVLHGETGYLFTPKSVEEAKNFILKLKHDDKLRATLGEKGHSTLNRRAINHVVADLLQWYELGINRHKQHVQDFWRMLRSFVLMLLIVPFGVVALGCYDVLMFFLMLFGYNPAEKVQEDEKKK